MSFAIWNAKPPFEFSPEDREQVYQVGSVWVVTDDPAKATQGYLDSLAPAQKNADIDAQIVALEQAAGGYNRGSREFMLGMAVILKQCVPSAPDISVTPGMVRIKALDDQIKALRAQRLP